LSSADAPKSKIDDRVTLARQSASWTGHAASGRNAVMSKSKENLSPQEWEARHDAACAIVAR
jgi:hypothetical protein